MLATSPPSGIGLQLIRHISFAGFAVLIPALLCTYIIVKTIYRCYFHPLSSYPGPKICAATRLWYIHKILSGRLPFEIQQLHLKYGPVVRVAPDELTYISSKGWDDIYGFRNGKPEMAKESPAYTTDAQPASIIAANRQKHAHFRRLMSRGFSEAALREQEPIIQGYVNFLMQRLHEETKQGRAVEMVSWYNFLTFDIIGDLAFGEPFGCLEKSLYHPWVKMIFDSFHFFGYKQSLGYYPKVEKLVPYLGPLLLPKSLEAKYASHNAMTKEKALRRKESQVDRADFVSNLIKPENNISDDELIGNSSILIIAGSETTATVLSAITWFLARNPEAMAKVTSEVRSAFKEISDINFINVSKLKYLLGCLNEALRLFPPVPSGTARVVPKGGDMIDGKWVAGGTQVSIFQFAANTNPSNFSRPLEFIPERWLDDPRFSTDDRSAMQPFSYGPRNCIGKNLAYVEMRLIIARMLWEFDLELCDGADKWNETNVYIVWAKKPLWVRLKPVVRP